MGETLHANIFFFITSVAVVAVTLMLVVVLWYIVAILREVQKIAVKVRKASDGLEQDLAHIRSEVRSNMTRLSALVASIGEFFLGGITHTGNRAHQKRKQRETKSTESV